MTNIVFDYAKWKSDFYTTADDEQKQAFKDFLRGVLREQRMNICFIKADGTERWLHCSLHPDLIPAEKLQKEEASTRKRSEEALAVWDIEKQDWRSFRYDSVKEFSFNLGELHI
jgi:hypothetical protein